MAYNFVAGDRDQLLLMPPSLAEWLPADHLAWFVLDVVGELDVSAFVAAYRADGRGGAAYEPSMMVALLVYAYCVGERSSRVIERRCSEDIAFRVIAVNQLPDHATIARFRATHQDALAELFGQVLGLCAHAGLVKAGLVAVDGTRIEANASRAANRSAEQLAKEILDDAATVDAEEDARLGAARGDELPAELTGSGRQARIRALLDELKADAAKRSYATQLARRAEIEATTGRRLPGRKPKPDAQHRRPRQLGNVTDPDSRLMRVPGGFVQAYNAQAVATVDQVIVAAEVTNDGSDDAQFVPMVAATKANLRAAGVRTRVRTVLADAGYWAKRNVDTPGVEALIAPGRTPDLKRNARTEVRRAEVLSRVERGDISILDAAAELGVGRSRVDQLLLARRRSLPPTPAVAMAAKLATPRGRRLYKKRSATIEPVFGQTKHNRGITRFARRGMPAVNSEWKLIAATHNILKLWRHANHPDLAFA
jgi:transposase